MTHSSQLLTSVLVAAATAGGVVFFLPRAESGAALPPVAATDPRLDALIARVEVLAGRMETPDLAAPGRAAVAPVDPALIEAAVGKWMQANAGKVGAAPDDGKVFDRAAALRRLQDLQPGSAAIRAAWVELRAAGLEAEVLQHYADLAAASPGDAQAQYQHGAMLIEALQDQPIAKTAQLATLADGAFDKALAVDPNHWAARYSKAISLSFWPKIMGRQPEAVRHFEILAKQQEAGAPKPQFAQTYVFLGNLYADSGDADIAREAYERGLRWYPDNSQLKQQLGAVRK